MLLTGLIAALALAGCTAPPQRSLSTELPDFVALPSGRNPMDTAQVISPLEEAGGTLALVEQRKGRRLNVLQLSGGGRNGAFGAGVLVGWSQSGERPEFDVVTGISTGALQSTFAFLGTEADDRVLEEVFTEITSDDVYTRRGILRALGGSSFLDSTPLARLIEKHITQEVLDRVAAEWDEGRILLVGTTNLDYQQLWVWNLGRLAKYGGPDALDTYRKVILASASPPGAFPPVEISGHLFADGAVVNNLLIIGQAGPSLEKVRTSSQLTGNVYVIHNGRTGTSPEAIAAGLRPLVSQSVALAMDAHMSSSLLRSYAVTTVQGYSFHLMQVPNDVELSKNTLDFDQAKMKMLFEVGRELGKRKAWLSAPPPTPEVRSWLIESVQRLAPAR